MVGQFAPLWGLQSQAFSPPNCLHLDALREKNAGWRIDYFIVSERLMPRVVSASIRADVLGSDHCPVVLELDV